MRGPRHDNRFRHLGRNNLSSKTLLQPDDQILRPPLHHLQNCRTCEEVAGNYQ